MEISKIEKLERTLSETKWFLYRAYSPEACDLLFAKEWLTSRDAFYDRHGLDIRFDDNGKPYRLPVEWSSLDDLMGDSDVWPNIQFLRRWADKRCLRYRDFWRAAFRVLVDCGNCYGNTPKTLVNGLVARNSIFDELRAESSRRITLDEDDRLKAAGYQGHKYQNDYAGYVVGEIKKRHPETYREKVTTLVKGGTLDPSIAGQLINQSIN